MRLRRILLWPFSQFYGAILRFRHGLYNLGLLRSERPTVPTIAIGNLALGGTGKTPMLELVLRTLADTTPLATLSRGYGRNTSTIHEVSCDDDAAKSGDEPLQVKTNFPVVRVFVGADRVTAIAQIQREIPDVKVVVLDDALQHRQLSAGFNILLTTAQRPYCNDSLFPAGTLRDVRSRARAAQIVVVTKCEQLPSSTEQEHWRERLQLTSAQPLFFAGIRYDEPRPWAAGIGQSAAFDSPLPTASCLLFTGIVDPAPLLNHLRPKVKQLHHIAFPDHHLFSTADLRLLADVFGSFAAGPKTLITTEKDAARLRSVLQGSPLENLPLVVIGMRTVILNEPAHFADLIHRHVATYPAHR